MPIATERSVHVRTSAVFIAVIAALAVFLYFSGFFVSKGTIEVAGCSAKYNTVPQVVKSGLCPDPDKECIAQPYIAEHNAFVEAALCACRIYADDETPPEKRLDVAGKLQAKYANRFSAPLTAEEICSGSDLVKWVYE